MKKKFFIIFLLTGLFGCFSSKADGSEHFAVTEREITYKVVNGYALKMIIYEPVIPEKQNLPAIVFYFGGGWNVGTNKLFQYHARYLASRGMVAFSPDYRVGSRVPGTKVADCLKDAKSAFRYIKQNAQQFGVDPNKIVASGTSAGGLLAADLALVDKFNESTDDTTIVVNPCAVVLYCPAIREEHDLLNDAYKERFDGQEEALSPYHNVKANTPPFIIMAGTNDTQVLIGDMRAFKARMDEYGNTCKLLEYKGQGHGFCLYTRSPYYFRETLRETENFLNDIVEFKAPSWVDDYVVSLGAVIPDISATLGDQLSYDSNGVNFIMNGNLPQIFVANNGVKYLQRNINTNNFSVNVTGSPLIYTSNGLLIVSSLHQNHKISIYDINGRTVKNIVSPNREETVELKKGIYIVKVDDYATKTII